MTQDNQGQSITPLITGHIKPAMPFLAPQSSKYSPYHSKRSFDSNTINLSKDKALLKWNMADAITVRPSAS